MESVGGFIDRYRAAWEAAIDGSAPAETLEGFFSAPCFMVSAEGEATLHETPASVTAFHEKRLAAFRESGVAQRRIEDIRVQSQGEHMALAIVDWALTRADGSGARAWRMYYTILIAGGAPRILVAGFRSEESVAQEEGLERFIRYRSTG